MRNVGQKRESKKHLHFYFARARIISMSEKGNEGVE